MIGVATSQGKNHRSRLHGVLGSADLVGAGLFRRSSPRRHWVTLTGGACTTSRELTPRAQGQTSRASISRLVKREDRAWTTCAGSGSSWPGVLTMWIVITQSGPVVPYWGFFFRHRFGTVTVHPSRGRRRRSAASPALRAIHTPARSRHTPLWRPYGVLNRSYSD